MSEGLCAWAPIGTLRLGRALTVETDHPEQFHAQADSGPTRGGDEGSRSCLFAELWPSVVEDDAVSRSRHRRADSRESRILQAT